MDNSDRLMNEQTRHIGLASLSFEISHSEAVCVEASGDTLAVVGATASDLLEHRVRFETLIHDADSDVAAAIFANETTADGKTYTFRLQSSVSDSVTIVKSKVSKSRTDKHGIIRLKITLAFPLTIRGDLVNQSLLMNFVSMLEHTDDFIYFKDKHHVFTGASQTLVKITNAESHWSELIGRTDYEVFSQEYADVYFRLEKQVFNGDVSVAQEIQPYLDKAGNAGWVDNRKYPIKDDDGEVVGLFGVARDVTRLIETENALKQSERQYRNIYENAPVGLFHSTLDGQLLGCNPAFAKMLGYDSPEQVLTEIHDLAGQVYVQRATRNKLIEQVGQDPSWVSLDIVDWRRRNGQIVHVELFGREVVTPNGDDSYIECAARDITSRVVAEKKLKRLNHLYVALSKSNEAIVRCQNEQQLYETVCENAVVHGDLAMAWVGILAEDGSTISPVASYGHGREYLQKVQISVDENSPSGKGPTGLAFREGKPVWCQDFQNQTMTKPWREIAWPTSWKASAAIPLHSNNQVIGTLNLYAQESYAFDEAAQNLLLEMAMDISYGLDRFREDRLIKQYDRDLRESQALNRAANRMAKIGAWAVELPEMKLIWSEEVHAIHGVPVKDEITVEKALTFYPGRYNHLVRKAVQQCMKDGSFYELDVPIITMEGEQRWTRISGQGVWDDAGNLTAIYGAMQDITRIKENEASLKKLNQAVEQSPSAVLITDTQARVVYVNQTFLEQTGYSEDEVLGQNPRFLQSGKTLPSQYGAMWAALEQGQPWRGEFYNKRKDGTEYIVSLLISPVRDDDGEIINYLAIEDDITEKKRVEEQVHYLAHFDQLTGLPNRTLLDEHFQFAINMAKRNSEQLSVMFMDLDNFKNVNDGLGHSVGDALLVELSQRLKNSLRSEDLVGRFGGDEFVMILPKTDSSGAGVLAQKLINKITEPFQIGPYKLTCTPSIGISIYPDDGREVETLSKNADAAMYMVKQLSKNDFMFYTPEMQAQSQRNLTLSSALRTALHDDALYLVYQLQVRLSETQYVGAEALLRWRHPEHGEISPAEFIPIAEENGLINEIGLWVLEKAISDMKQLMPYVADDFQIAVNLSVVQFRNQHLVTDIEKLLKKYEMPAAKLMLELTEAVAMSEPEIGIAIIDDLHALGVSIAIDDFGTGYSSLSYLKRFRVNKLKIDKSFIDDIEHDPEDRAIVSAVVSMSESLGLRTIAEGVETQGQIDFLKQEGCDEVQGYYFSKPRLFKDLLTTVAEPIQDC